MVEAVEKARRAEHGLVQLPPRPGRHAGQAAHRRGQARPASSTTAPSSCRTGPSPPTCRRAAPALWRLDVAAAGRGVTGDLLAHCIDTAIWLNGAHHQRHRHDRDVHQGAQAHADRQGREGRHRRRLRRSCAASPTARWPRSNRPATPAATRRSTRSRSTASTPRSSGTCTTCTGCSTSTTATRATCAAGARSTSPTATIPTWASGGCPACRSATSTASSTRSPTSSRAWRRGKPASPTFRDALRDHAASATRSSPRRRRAVGEREARLQPPALDHPRHRRALPPVRRAQEDGLRRRRGADLRGRSRALRPHRPRARGTRACAAPASPSCPTRRTAPSAPDPTCRQGAAERLRLGLCDCLSRPRAARCWPGPIISRSACSPASRRPRPSGRIWVEVCRETSPLRAGSRPAALARGAQPVRVLLPEHGRRPPPGEARWAHPSFGQLYDTFHANIEEKSTPRRSATAPHQPRPHLRERPRHARPRPRPLSSRFDALKGAGYDGWLTIEAFGVALPDLAAATKVWRPLFARDADVYEGAYRLMRRGWDSAA